MSTARLVLDSALKDLDVVLDAEREALRLLDSRTVQQIAEKKTAIEKQIRQALDQGAGTHDSALVHRVHMKTQDNQILLVHARNCVRAALEAAIGNPQETYDSNRPPPPRAVRFDLKG